MVYVSQDLYFTTVFRVKRETMRVSCVFVTPILLVLITVGECKRKFDGDFEFAEEVSCYFVNYL